MIAPAPIIRTDCLLVVTVTQLPDALQLRYEVTNTSGQPLYLFNKLARAGGASVFDTDPNAANIILSPERVTVSKTLVPVPDDKEVERPYVPCLSRLLPNEKLAEHMLLATPLSPFTWYASRPMRTAPVHRALFFEMGYVVASAEVERYIQPLSTPYGQVYTASWFPLELQETILSGPLLPEALVFSAR
ncbi:hypothetical protein [Hymenobacter negativus]|uniref:Uncharacterized protein n=1 Tax=Hymenobacter negativus TaxID=2795026 RepID=A0ABS3QGJ3_9BACT|nr:hypothetical protein [Hymenobacter negativus]MBO2010367.1 hypothetical protein [Hymenobacter negativus]